MGTVPGSDLAGLAAGARAGGFCSSCADVLAPLVISGLGGGSGETAELQEDSGDRRTHLQRDGTGEWLKLSGQWPQSPRRDKSGGLGRLTTALWDTTVQTGNS